MEELKIILRLYTQLYSNWKNRNLKNILKLKQSKVNNRYRILYIGLATILLPPNDKIHNHIVANPIF